MALLALLRDSDVVRNHAGWSGFSPSRTGALTREYHFAWALGDPMKNVARVLWACVLLTGCALQPPARWTNADYAAWDRFLAEREARTRALEAEGDQALAAGDRQRAADLYAKAAQATEVRGRTGCGMDPADNGYVVTEVLPDLPCASAGVRVGDLIVAINGKQAVALGPAQRDIELWGAPGDAITMSIERGGADPADFRVMTTRTAMEIRPTDEFALTRPSILIGKAASAVAAAPPPVSAVARSHATNAQKLAATAKTKNDYGDVGGEYRIAAAVAPWWSDLHVNRALFFEAIGDAVGATQALNHFLQASPNSPEATTARAKLAALAPKADEQKRLMAWEGFWGEVVNGQATNSGIAFERNGRILTASNRAGVVYVRATIVDDHTAQSVERYTTENAGGLAGVLQRCFNGVLEIPSTMRLSADRQTLEYSTQSDFNIDSNTCQVVSRAGYVVRTYRR